MVGSGAGRRLSWVAYALTAGVPSDYFFTALIYGGAWAIGAALARRAKRIDELLGEADRLRCERAEAEGRIIAEERARIARELHDIVSHSITVIAIQSQAVRRRLGNDHELECADLRAIEATARQAMTEMRAMLGVLRNAATGTDLAPQPGLDQLDQLAHDARAAGVTLDLHIEGEPEKLAPGIDLSAYRIVQEALTNCRKHAPGAAVSVTVRFNDGWVELRIDDNGASRGSDPADGHGVIGMRERALLYGGELDAWARPGGGFSVRAKLPAHGRIGS